YSGAVLLRELRSMGRPSDGGPPTLGRRPFIVLLPFDCLLDPTRAEGQPLVIDYRENQQCKECRGDQATYDYYSQWFLTFRTDSGTHCCGHESDRCHQCGHHNWSGPYFH